MRGVSFCLIAVGVLGGMAKGADKHRLDPEIERYLQQRADEFDQIPDERKADLESISKYISRCQSEGRPARMTFVCTHNSRRSHLSQIWAKVAAEYYGVANVETFSGGTEATAFNPRAVAALERAGLKITAVDPRADNPRYQVRFRDDGEPLVCFSKVFSESPNPTENFCAVMTCSQADAACPLVRGSELRVAITYEDPKVSDGSPLEAATYDERSRQIAREMLYVFARVPSAGPASPSID